MGRYCWRVCTLFVACGALLLVLPLCSSVSDYEVFVVHQERRYDCPFLGGL